MWTISAATWHTAISIILWGINVYNLLIFRFQNMIENSALRAFSAVTRLTVHRRSQVIRDRYRASGTRVVKWQICFFRDGNEEFSKVISSFFDLDQISPIGRSCAHYTLNLICSRRKLQNLVGATKWFEGVKIYSAARAIDKGEMNKTQSTIEWSVGIMNVRSIDLELPIRWMSA